jgi:hypothetical protein
MDKAIAIGDTMDCIEIGSADNGFVLRYKDPEIIKANADSDGWQDPYRSRVYDSADKLADDLKRLLPIMKQYGDEKNEADEYRSAMAEAFAQDN